MSVKLRTKTKHTLYTFPSKSRQCALEQTEYPGYAWLQVLTFDTSETAERCP